MELPVDPVHMLNHCISRLEIIERITPGMHEDVSAMCYDVKLTLHDLANMFKHQSFQTDQE